MVKSAFVIYIPLCVIPLFLRDFFPNISNDITLTAIIVLISSIVGITIIKLILIKKLPKKVLTETLNDIDRMEVIEFEEYLKKLYEKLGHSAHLTKRSHDQGADLILTSRILRRKIVIQAKRYSNKVGNKAIGEVLTAKGVYGCYKGIVATNNYFTPDAIEAAKKNKIQLIDRDELQKLIAEASIRKKRKKISKSVVIGTEKSGETNNETFKSKRKILLNKILISSVICFIAILSVMMWLPTNEDSSKTPQAPTNPPQAVSPTIFVNQSQTNTQQTATHSFPNADFSASPTSGKAPLVVTVIDKTFRTPTQTPTFLKWDFRNGIYGEGRNLDDIWRPTYSKPGIYTINWTVSNAYGSNTKSCTITVF